MPQYPFTIIRVIEQLMNTTENSSILGVKIHTIDKAQALDTIEAFIRSRKPHMVVTLDASAVVLAHREPELMEIINSADLVTPDSIGILWAAKRFGIDIPERVSGVELVEHLCERGAKTGYRPYLLGAAPGIAEAAAETLKERYPGLQIAGIQHGFFSEEDCPGIVEKIKDAKPDMLFAAMGIPRQEKWIRKYMAEMNVPISMGVGGTFDVLSGRVKRAPKWMQRVNLEWLYRLANNPKKIGKCSTLPIFTLMVLRAGKRNNH